MTDQVEAQDVVNAMAEILASSSRELAFAVARGNKLLKQVAALQAEIAELKKEKESA